MAAEFTVQPIVLGSKKNEPIEFVPERTIPAHVRAEAAAVNSIASLLAGKGSQDEFFESLSPARPPLASVHEAREIETCRKTAGAHIQAGRFEEALAPYGRAIGVVRSRGGGTAPIELRCQELGGLHMARSGVYAELGRWVEALADARIAAELLNGAIISKGEPDPVPWRAVGRCLARLGRVREAREAVEGALMVLDGDGPLRELLAKLERVEAEGGLFTE